MSKQDSRQDNKQVAAEGMSTSETIRKRILEIPENEDFIITIQIGGDLYADEQG